MWNDRRLARRAARGDSEAFAAIFRCYQQDLYRYCAAILGNPQDAQDALQNTMVKALRTLPGEPRQIELKPWLYRVAHNESIELRRRGRPTAALEEGLLAPGGDVEQTAADRIRLRDLLADVGELPERHRGALVMRELAGLDFEEIGEALDTSPRAARQVLYEARQSLQQMSDGREMECDAVTAKLSERDGRVARRRDLRAHLRDCPECRRFEEGIHSRTETLAGIAPLPALAAAAIAKGALAGGCAAAGAGSAGGTGAAGATGGAAGLAGGVAKVASTGAILKSTVAIVAVVGAGAVAVDHSDLLHHGSHGSSPRAGTTSPTNVAEPGSADTTAEPTTSADPQRGVLSHYLEPTGAGEVDLSRATAIQGVASPGHSVTATPEPRPEPRPSSPKADAAEPSTVPASPSIAEPAEGSVAVPAEEVAPVTPRAHPEHPAHPVHPSKPKPPTAAEAPVESRPPPEPASPPKTKGPPESKPAPQASEEATPPEEPEVAPPKGPPTEPPGQAKK